MSIAILSIQIWLLIGFVVFVTWYVLVSTPESRKRERERYSTRKRIVLYLTTIIFWPMLVSFSIASYLEVRRWVKERDRKEDDVRE